MSMIFRPPWISQPQVLPSVKGSWYVYMPAVAKLELRTGKGWSASQTIATAGGLRGLTSSHYVSLGVPTNVKSAQTGTVLLVYMPTYYWGSFAFGYEVLYSYSAKGFEYYLELCYRHGATRYNLTAFGEDVSGQIITLACSHNGTQFVSAWKSSRGKSGLTSISGSEWFGDNTWANNSNDVVSLNATYSAGSASESSGNLILAAYMPDVVLSTPQLLSLRDNPWQIFEQPKRNLFAFATAGGGSTWNLDPTNVSHLHSVTPSLVNLDFQLSPDSTTHLHFASSPNIATGILLVADSTVHLHSVTQESLQLELNLSPAGASHLQSVSSPNISLVYTLGVNGTTHLHSVVNAEISTGLLLSPNSANHLQSVTNASLLLTLGLLPDSTVHAQTVDSIVASLGLHLTPIDASHLHLVSSSNLSIVSSGGTGTVTIPTLLINLETGELFKPLWKTL